MRAHCHDHRIGDAPCGGDSRAGPRCASHSNPSTVRDAVIHIHKPSPSGLSRGSTTARHLCVDVERSAEINEPVNRPRAKPGDAGACLLSAEPNVRLPTPRNLHVAQWRGRLRTPILPAVAQSVDESPSILIRSLIRLPAQEFQ